MSPASFARKEPPGSFTMSDVFEIETINNGGNTSSFVGSLRHFSS